jgi:hypothetical protein
MVLHIRHRGSNQLGDDVTGHPRLNQKNMNTKKFSIEIQHDTEHDRYIGKVIDSDGNVIANIDTLVDRILFSVIVNTIKNNIK